MQGFKKVAAAALMAGLMAPTFAFAQTSTSTSAIQTLLNQIKTLQAQIVALQTQQVTALISLQTTLNEGSKGENVKILQQLLAQDPSIYPEGLVTGFYGRLTSLAVKRFQKKHGLDQVGRVGPRTLSLLNQFFKMNSSSTIGHGKDHENDDEDNDNGNDEGSNTPGNGNNVAICHKTGNWWNWHTIYVNEHALKAHLKHGDTQGFCAGQGTTTPPVVDTTAPVISGVAANSIAATGANIVWTTNENSTSQVEYGPTNAYGIMTSLNTSLVTSHSVALSGLTASTTYHFRVWSKDAANNSASSSDMMFTTSQPADTTAPILTGITTTAIGSTTATVSWNTNEAATGKVYFSTSNPIDLSTAATMTNLALSSSHAFVLTGLTASSTYYFVVESKDAGNNTASSSQMSFLTLSI